MVLYRLPIMILTMSLVYLFIVPDEPYLFKLFFKLVPMFIIIFYAFRLLPKRKNIVHYLILAGLLLSLIGDAAFRLFLIGSIFSFLAFVCYTIGFFSKAAFTKVRTISILPIIAIAVIAGWKLISSLAAPGTDGTIFLLISYTAIFSLMLWAAILTGNTFAISGSLLFTVSYVFLAWHTFVGALSFEPFIILAYYAAQLLITLSMQSLTSADQRIVW